MASHRASPALDATLQNTALTPFNKMQNVVQRPACAASTGGSLLHSPSLSSTTLPGNNLSLTRFHVTKHGSNVQISDDGRTALRLRGYCRSIVISRHPVPPLKFLFLRLRRFDPTYRGMLRFGWTVHAPETINDVVISGAKYLVPDTVDEHSGWWGGALSAEMQSAILQPNMRENTIIYLFRQLHGPTFVGLLNAVTLGSDGGGIASAQASLSVLSQRSKNNVPDTTLSAETGAWFVMDLYGETNEVEILDAKEILQLSGNTSIGFDWNALALNLIRQYALHQQQQNANHQLARSLLTMTNNINTINSAVQPPAGEAGRMSHRSNSSSDGNLLDGSILDAAGRTATDSGDSNRVGAHLPSRTTSMKSTQLLHANARRATYQPSGLATNNQNDSLDPNTQRASDYLLSLRSLSLLQHSTSAQTSNTAERSNQPSAVPNTLTQAHDADVLHAPPRPAAPLPRAVTTGEYASGFGSNSQSDAVVFHAGMSGCNVTLRNQQREAHLAQPYFCYGHLFSNRPVKLGEPVHLQILQVSSEYMGSLGFGVTSADPAMLDSTALPADINRLLDRSEYWVVVTNLAERAQPNDVITFRIGREGQVQVAGSAAATMQQQAFRTVFYVDTSRPLYILFSLYGTTRRVRLLSTITRQQHATRLDTSDTRSAALSDVRQNSAASNIYHTNSVSFTRQAIAAAVLAQGAHLQARALNSRLGRAALHAITPASLRGDTAVVDAVSGASSVADENNNRRQTAPALPRPLVSSSLSLDATAPDRSVQPFAGARQDLTANAAHNASPFVRRSIRGRRTSVTSSLNAVPGDSDTLAAILPPATTRNNYAVLNSYSSSSQNRTISAGDTGNSLFVPPPTTQPIPPPRSAPRSPAAGASCVRARPTPSVSSDVLPRVVVVSDNINKIMPAESSVPSSSGAGGSNIITTSCDECCVCLDRDVDCVLYRCGHMCMCSVCAFDTLERSGSCPICRSDIVEVIKTYRS